MAVPGVFGDLLYMESLLFCNKQLELIWLISVCLGGCAFLWSHGLHIPVLTCVTLSCG